MLIIKSLNLNLQMAMKSINFNIPKPKRQRTAEKVMRKKLMRNFETLNTVESLTKSFSKSGEKKKQPCALEEQFDSLFEEMETMDEAGLNELEEIRADNQELKEIYKEKAMELGRLRQERKPREWVEN